MRVIRLIYFIAVLGISSACLFAGDDDDRFQNKKSKKPKIPSLRLVDLHPNKRNGVASPRSDCSSKSPTTPPATFDSDEDLKEEDTEEKEEEIEAVVSGPFGSDSQRKRKKSFSQIIGGFLTPRSSNERDRGIKSEEFVVLGDPRVAFMEMVALLVEGSTVILKIDSNGEERICIQLASVRTRGSLLLEIVRSALLPENRFHYNNLFAGGCDCWILYEQLRFLAQNQGRIDPLVERFFNFGFQYASRENFFLAQMKALLAHLLSYLLLHVEGNERAQILRNIYLECQSWLDGVEVPSGSPRDAYTLQRLLYFYIQAMVVELLLEIDENVEGLTDVGIFMDHVHQEFQVLIGIEDNHQVEVLPVSPREGIVLILNETEPVSDNESWHTNILFVSPLDNYASS